MLWEQGVGIYTDQGIQFTNTVIVITLVNSPDRQQVIRTVSESAECLGGTYV